MNNATAMIATSRSDDSVEQFKETHILRDVSCGRENAVFYRPFTPLSFDLFRPVIYRRTYVAVLVSTSCRQRPGMGSRLQRQQQPGRWQPILLSNLSTISRDNFYAPHKGKADLFYASDSDNVIVNPLTPTVAIWVQL